MDKIINLHGNDIPTALRNIADGIEAGEIDGTTCTIICGCTIYCPGNISTQRAVEIAIWDMTYGIHKLMYAAVREDD